MSWRVQVLGRLALSQGSAVITHFESRMVGALLAYLALYPQRPHPREELIDLLWPEADLDAGRHRLRQALSTLRRQLEPPGTPYGSVLLADRHAIRLNPETFTCDAADFERLVRQKRFAEAVALYAGDLLPGYYEDWILLERNRLTALYERLSPEQALIVNVEDSRRAEKDRQVSLPSYLTEFVGRENERRQLSAHLTEHRLVTITGLGGSGKTRLAVETARQAAADFDRVAFVPLTACTAREQILEALRVALQLPAASVSALDQIHHILSDGRTLLVLDNFEQLVEADGSASVESLLDRLPQLTCLVSSRQLLGVPGEQEFPLSPLPVPAEGLSFLEIAQCPSIALFLQRAQAVRPGFHLSERNQTDLVALCCSLEGIPLALELAASRIRALSPAEMRSQIGTRFQWLVRSGPGAEKEPRQRSLLATLEWSWRLLNPGLQRFLSTLSVFRGGWTADTAAAVSRLEDAREPLEALIMASLVLSEEASDGTTRFRMLETVREFAREQLEAEEVKRVRQQHRAVFLALAKRAGDQGDTLLREADNLLAALETAIEDDDADTAFAFFITIDDRWLGIAGAGTALSLVRRALALSGGETSARIRTLELASYLALLDKEGDLAREYLAEALRLAGDDPVQRASALLAEARAGIMSVRPLPEISACLQEAVALARAAGEIRIEGLASRMLGVTSNRERNYAQAEAHLRRSLSLLEQAGDRQSIIHALDNLANTLVQRGELDRALEFYADCEQKAIEIGNVVYQAKVYQNYATVYARQERWEEGLAAGRECIRRNQAMGNAYILAYALWNLPEPLTYLGEDAAAAQIMSFAERFWTERYGPLLDHDYPYLETIRTRVVDALGTEQTEILWKAGERLTLPQAIAVALAEEK